MVDIKYISYLCQNTYRIDVNTILKIYVAPEAVELGMQSEGGLLAISKGSNESFTEKEGAW